MKIIKKDEYPGMRKNLKPTGNKIIRKSAPANSVVSINETLQSIKQTLEKGIESKQNPDTIISEVLKAVVPMLQNKDGLNQLIEAIKSIKFPEMKDPPTDIEITVTERDDDLNAKKYHFKVIK